MKLFGVLADTQGCGWYRMIMPFTEVARRNPGWRLYLDGLMPDRVDGIDVLVAQRTCLPEPSATFQRHCREGAVRTVLELDDDLWSLDPANRAAVKFYTPELLENLRRNVELADVVTTTTEPLAEVLRQMNPNVVVLPNMIPKWLLHHDRPVTNGRVTLGWAGGPGHSRDFGEMAAPVRRLLQHPRFRDEAEFHMIGGPDWTDRVSSPRSTTRHTGWFPNVEDLYRALDFDLGLAPLRPTPFNDAKSDVKLLEYAALGIPAIASDTGPYQRAEAAGALALLCRTARDWAAALEALVNDAEARDRMGKEAREWAATRSIETNAHLWESAYGAK
ncbi:glycosyltransferase [Amycolatopsis thailandensis]|uniref:glycosyltransferase n=1 Tax=Amycolatopsis thailandensis TaxID=589330 RepID=UPI0036672916